MSDNIVTELAEYLNNQPEITALLGSDEIFPAWIFEETMAMSKEAFEGSSKCAIVITQDDGWTSPNEHNNMEFPLIDIFIYADPSRDFMNNVTFDDTSDKITTIRRALDKHLHRVDGLDVMWGDIRVLRSTRLNHQRLTPITEGDGMRSGMVSYAVGIG